MNPEKISRLVPFFCFAALLGLCFSPPFYPAAAVERVEARGNVIKVVVYRQEAEVTKVVEPSLPAGASEIRVPLPPSAKDAVLQARSDEGTQIGELRVEREAREEVTDETVRRLEEEARALEMEREAEDHRIDAANERIQFARQMRIAYNEKLAKESLALTPAAEAHRKLADAVSEEILKGHQLIREAKENKRKIDARLEKARAELKEMRSRRSKQEKFVVLAVTRGAPGAARLELTYLVGGARWQPAYDARIEPERGALQMDMYGVIHQNSGEDWEGVRLFLSTGDPARGAQMPNAPPWYLEPPRAQGEMRYSGSAEFMEAAPAEKPEPAAAPAMKSKAVRAERKLEVGHVAFAGAVTTFEIPQVTSLPSDGKEHRVLMSDRSLPVTLMYRAVAMLSEKAYLWAEATNDTDHPMLAGRVHVFVEGAYVGQSDIPNVPSGDTLELSAGIDERISVERKRLKDMTGESWTGKKTTVRRGWEIGIRNLRNRPARLRVIERVPVSKHEEIQVDIMETTSGYEMNPEGILTWDREVPPGKRLALRLGYRVTLPTEWKGIVE